VNKSAVAYTENRSEIRLTNQCGFLPRVQASSGHLHNKEDKVSI